MVYGHKCIGCGLCITSCSNGAIENKDNVINTDHSKCTSCGECTKVCASKARVIQGEDMTADYVIEQIDDDIPFYRNSGGGVTFSGGEPLLNHEFIIEVAGDYKDKGLSTAVETCGYVPWENIEKVKEFIDLFLYDIKFIDSEKHKKYCGKSNDLILDNLKKICVTNDVIIRMPLIPGINDMLEDIELACRFLNEIKDEIKEIHCLPYHNLGISKYEALGKEYELEHVKVPDQEHLEEIRKHFSDFGLDVQIGG